MNIFVILISALLIIIVLLRRRVPIGPAILTAGIFIWAAAAPQPHYLLNAWIETFSAYRTYDLIFALYFVMCLEIELRTGAPAAFWMTLCVHCTACLKARALLLPLCRHF